MSFPRTREAAHALCREGLVELFYDKTGMGWGMRALKFIRNGTLILEEPCIAFGEARPCFEAAPTYITPVLIRVTDEEAYNELTYCRRKIADPCETELHLKYFTNSYDAELETMWEHGLKLSVPVPYAPSPPIIRLSGAVGLVISRINNSCWPSAAVRVCVKKPKELPLLQLFSLRDINCGEEVTTVYCADLDVRKRRKHLLENYGFLCECAFCKKQLES